MGLNDAISMLQVHYVAKWKNITFMTSRQGLGVGGGTVRLVILLKENIVAFLAKSLIFFFLERTAFTKLLLRSIVLLIPFALY